MIRSKIDNLVLLDWLVFIGEFPPIQTWLQQAGVATGDADFHSVLGRLFLREMEKITRLHLRKDYAPVTIESATIRGRVLLARLAQRSHRLPSIAQRYRSRTLDTKYNRILAHTLDKLPVLLAEPKVGEQKLAAERKRLGGLRDLWAGVRRELTDPIETVNESQWASPPSYAAGLQLARLILMGSALNSASRTGGQAFIISLSSIWEDALRRLFKLGARATNWTCASEAAHTRNWDDWASSNDPARWLRADLLAERDHSRWVLDAKYKRGFGNESRADRFQMCAYAVAFDAGRVSLVYPTAAGPAKAAVRLLLKATVGTKTVVIDSIDLPMGEGPQMCLTALQTLMNQRC